MMEKSKRKPKEKVKNGEDARAQIEFAAPYSLAECLFRLRDTKNLQTGFISPGIDPSFEKIDNLTYQIRIRRTWYDYRYRKHYSYVEVRGYLRALDNDTTMVIGKIRISPMAFLIVGVLSVLMASVIVIPSPRSADLFLVFLFLTVPGVFGAMLYFDRRTLIHLLHHTLGGDL
jgi:hypothetical protein